MGAWSHEPFGNDTACDWSYGLLEGRDLSPVEAALDAVLSADYVEADQASEAIAAIEVLAKLLGNGTQADTYTEDIDQWVKDNPQRPSPNLLKKAKDVLQRINSPGSELLEQWEEGGEAEAWKSSLQQLVVATSA